jgi:hypothetical protein
VETTNINVTHLSAVYLTTLSGMRAVDPPAQNDYLTESNELKTMPREAVTG